MSDQPPPPPPPPPGEPAAAPPQPAAAPPQPAVVSRERKWLPVLGVILVMAFVSVGGYVFAGEPQGISDPEPTLGDPITVTEGLTIRPAEGWEVGEPLAFDLPNQGVTLNGVRLIGGIAKLDAVAAPGAPADPVDVWNIYVQDFLLQDAEQLRTSQELEPFTTDSGVQGVRGYYVGVFTGVASPIEGEIAAIVTPEGIGVIADGWAPEGQLGGSVDTIRSMVSTLGAG